MSARVGDSRVGPTGEEVRCFDASSWTSSRWISYDGSAYRLYHAGDGVATWSAPLLPLVDDAGWLRFGGKVRLEQALARAWHPLSHPFARHPRVRVIDDTAPVCAGNVCWEEPPSELDENVEETFRAEVDEHVATTFQFVPPVRLPPCVDAALLATGSATTLDGVAATCGVSRVTALNYLGKGLSKCPNRACPRRVLALLDETLSEALQTRSDSMDGSLYDLAMTLPRSACEEAERLAQLRVARLCLRALAVRE